MANESEPAEAGTGSGESTEYVEIDQASDEDLDSFLSGASSTAEPESTDEEPEPQSEEVEAQPEQEAEPEGDKPVSRKEYAELLQKLERQLKQNKDQKSFIDRQANELGDLRRRYAESIGERSKRIRSGELDPDQEFRERAALVAEERALENTEQQIGEVEQVRQNYEAIVSHLGDGPLPLEDMAEIFRADGVPEEGIQAFMQNPLRFPAIGIIQTAKRAKERKALVKLYEVATQLKKERDDFEKRLKVAPKQVVNKLNSALKSTPSINGSTGGGSSTNRVNVADITALSDQEIDALLGG